MSKKTETIKRLESDGHTGIALEVKEWKSTADNNWGWDRWFATEYPSLAEKYDVGQTRHSSSNSRQGRSQ